MEVPDEWPSEIQQAYDPIRLLGKGGFASVVLARGKPIKAGTENPVSDARSRNSGNKKVAIKVVGIIHESDKNLTAAYLQQQRDQAVMYARREIEILKHVHHPNIVQLLDHWIVDESDSTDKTKNNVKRGQQKNDLTAAVLVLEYAKGPTVDSLLKHGGALSTTFGRVVIAQTMDAIAYLHCHAVLHRDIKPDNILVARAFSTDSFIWDNDHGDGEDSLIDRERERPEPNWEALRSKYKVTLIDFGFSRALSPSDVAKPSVEFTLEDSELASYHRLQKDSYYKDTNGDFSGDELGTSQRSTKKSSIRRRISRGILDSSVHRLLSRRNPNNSDEISKSVTHKIKRTMSALGNKNFAAPEIINKVRTQYRPRTEPSLNQPNHSQTTETISNYVADYGLLVDSYSMGHTIRYMMTGVVPGISVEDAMAQQQTTMWIKKVFSLCLGSSKNGKQQKRVVRYRRMYDLPGEVLRLVGALTQASEQKRLSIRKARWNFPWIADVLQSQKPPTISFPADHPTQTGEKHEEKEGEAPASEDPPIQNGFHHISYLPFATENDKAAKDVTRESSSTAIAIEESALSF